MLKEVLVYRDVLKLGVRLEFMVIGNMIEV